MSKVINSLSLDYTRQETGSLEQTENTIKGHITYCKTPFVFIFTITEPTEQIMYLNSNGAFFLEDDTIYDFSENTDFLLQTCNDFLNWFKEDFGLSESDFSPSLTWYKNGQTITQWDCNTSQEQPLNKVLVQTDSFGRFTELKMYMDSETLVTKTSLSCHEYGAGFSYPTLISSVSFEDGLPIIKTELKLSQIKFNFPCELLIPNEQLNFSSQEIEFTSETPTDISFAKRISSPVSPAQTVYRVSLPSVIVNTSYKFYKKFITNQDTTNCPFYPSCSQYMLEAVSKNGIAGFIQGIERLKRCTATEHKRNLYPTMENGKHYDPVPEKGAK